MTNNIEDRRRKLMEARTVAIQRRDWNAMNEITKRLAKLPIKGNNILDAVSWPGQAGVVQLGLVLGLALVQIAVIDIQASHAAGINWTDDQPGLNVRHIHVGTLNDLIRPVHRLHHLALIDQDSGLSCANSRLARKNIGLSSGDVALTTSSRYQRPSEQRDGHGGRSNYPSRPPIGRFIAIVACAWFWGWTWDRDSRRIRDGNRGASTTTLGWFGDAALGLGLLLTCLIPWPSTWNWWL